MLLEQINVDVVPKFGIGTSFSLIVEMLLGGFYIGVVCTKKLPYVFSCFVLRTSHMFEIEMI